MPFKPGDHVHVTNLGRGIVREVRANGRYVVELKGRSIVLVDTLLKATQEDKRRPKDGGVVKAPEHAISSGRTNASDTIDLHGLTAAEAVTALDGFLNDALLAALAEVRVIHGRSGGRLKAAVHQRLREIPSIRGFRIDPANPGLTIVSL